MTETTTIAEAKNNLPKLIHATEAGQDIHLTRHGRPVAVLISESRYQQMFGTGKAVYAEMLRWREEHGDLALTDKEVHGWRDRSPSRDFSGD